VPWRANVKILRSPLPWKRTAGPRAENGNDPENGARSWMPMNRGQRHCWVPLPADGGQGNTPIQRNGRAWIASAFKANRPIVVDATRAAPLALTREDQSDATLTTAHVADSLLACHGETGPLLLQLVYVLLHQCSHK
jgi:hypothetical protein